MCISTLVDVLSQFSSLVNNVTECIKIISCEQDNISKFQAEISQILWKEI